MGKQDAYPPKIQYKTEIRQANQPSRRGRFTQAIPNLQQQGHESCNGQTLKPKGQKPELKLSLWFLAFVYLCCGIS
jgi:hypothetical protein